MTEHYTLHRYTRPTGQRWQYYRGNDFVAEFGEQDAANHFLGYIHMRKGTCVDNETGQYLVGTVDQLAEV